MQLELQWLYIRKVLLDFQEPRGYEFTSVSGACFNHTQGNEGTRRFPKHTAGHQKEVGHHLVTFSSSGLAACLSSWGKQASSPFRSLKCVTQWHPQREICPTLANPLKYPKYSLISVPVSSSLPNSQSCLLFLTSVHSRLQRHGTPAPS